MQTTGLRGTRLSFQQKRLWSFQGMNNTYRAQCAVWLKGKLDVKAFQQAFKQIAEQHEILRTVFYVLPGMDVPVQVIGSPEVACTIVNLEDVHIAIDENLLDTYFTQLMGESFDLAHGPLFRATLFCLSEEMSLLIVSIPSLCADSTSLSVIITELCRRYDALLSDQTLTEEALQYAAISAWQNTLLSTETAKIAREFWSKIDLSWLATMHLPFGREKILENNNVKNAERAAFEVKMQTMIIEKTVAAQLHALAQRYEVSPSAVWLACWQAGIWRLTKETHLVLGVACDGRLYDELKRVPGLYTRFVPIEVNLQDNWSFEKLIVETNQTLQEAIKWQFYFSWEAKQSAVGGKEDQELFPVVFEYENWPGTLNASELVVTPVRQFCCAEPFRLKLKVLHVEESWQCELHYDPKYFTSEQTSRLISVLQTLLQNVVERPEAALGHVPLLGKARQEELLRLGEGPRRPQPACLWHQLVEQQARLHPQWPAVLDRGQQWSYEQLNEQANQLARGLQQRGVGPGVLVGLYLERGGPQLLALLSILKAGGAYLPLDPQTPSARLGEMLQESEPQLLLCQTDLGEPCPGWQERTLDWQQLQQECRRLDEHDLPASSTGQDLAYVIYTSGSTGRPKGVMIEQQNLLNYSLGLCERIGAQPGWQYATVSTLAADLGNTAIMAALASGGCVQVLDYETLSSALAFERWVSEHPIDVLKIVPSHLSALLAGQTEVQWLPRQALILGGEVFPVRLVQQLRALAPTCRIYNHYGPTETTVGVLMQEVGEQESERVALGRPLSNSVVYVLDGQMHLVPVGVPGELYIGGAGVGRGYLGQGEQTAQRFVPDPYGPAGARLYRTGDLGRLNEAGLVEFGGRVDSQVKLRGYRIELAEIDATLLHAPNIRGCVVMLREDEPGQPQLVAYIVPQHQPAPSLIELRSFLQERLPAYMLPSALVSLRFLPLNANGKLDRQALPPPSHEGNTAIAYIAPRNPVEEILVGIWEEALKVKPVGIYHDFFLLGGHSLLATQIMARLQSIFQIELPLRYLFDAPTVSQLAELVKQALQSKEQSEVPPLVPVSRDLELPLSFAQQRLWFLNQLAPESTAYLISRNRRLHGVLHRQALHEGLQELIHRHEILRTTFQKREDLPVQVIHSEEVLHLPVVDMQGLPQEERSQQVHRLIQQERQQPFNLSKGPLFRTLLVQLAPEEHVLLMTMHHIISDASSNKVFFQELTSLYQAFVAGRPSPLLPLPIQYADYAVWQRRWLQGAVMDAQLAYWKRQLAGASSLDLPLDHPRPPMQTFQGASQRRHLPAALSQGLLRLSQQENVTVFMVLLAAFQVLLARYSGQTDICVGTPIANRTRAELEGLIGFFVNTLVLRTDLSGNPSFQQLLTRVREVALGAYMHQDVPFEHLVEELQPVRDLSRSSLFQVLLSVQQATEQGDAPEELTLETLKIEHATAKFDLTLDLFISEQGLSCVMVYNTDLFDATTISRMLSHWQILLEGIVAAPETLVEALPLLSPEERRRLLIDWNTTERPLPDEMGLAELLEAQGARTPDAIAVVVQDCCLTYGALSRYAQRVAVHLQRLQVRPGSIVGLCLDRSLELMIGLLGILKAGGAYLPLDPTLPPGRLSWMLEDSGAGVVVTQRQWIEIMPFSQLQVLCLPEVLSQDEQEPMRKTFLDAEQLAYIIYTSGSTGRPKGVMIRQRSVVNYTQEMQRRLAPQGGMQFATVSTLAADLGNTVIFASLASGGCLHLLPYEVILSGERFAHYGREHGIDVLKIVPSHLQALLTSCPGELRPFLLPRRFLVFGGESLSWGVVNEVRELGGCCAILNHYGPTETTIGVLVNKLEEQQSRREPGEKVPLGRPLANTEAYILDRSQQLVPIGVVGELYIGGEGLAQGYLNRADMTAEAFQAHPLSRQGGRRLYRTGDRARYLPDGMIEYVGRNDQQIKLRGNRIELGEIEAVVEQHRQVQRCVAVVQTDVLGGQRLVGYVVGKDVMPSSQELRSYLQERLPEFMIPSQFVSMQRLPLTSNGKIDRQALPRADYSAVQQQHIYPRDALEAQLLLIWREVLGVEQLDITNNFFELGGHSILAVRLMSRIEALVGRELALSMLFQYPTIAEMAVVLRREASDDKGPVLVPIQPLGSKLPFFCLPPLGGTFFRYYSLAHHLGTDYPFYGLQIPDLDEQGSTYDNLKDLANFYINAIQARQPEGPYLLGGWSLGGSIAFEMAQQLSKQGNKVALLAIMDSGLENLPGAMPAHVEPLDLGDLALARMLLQEHYPTALLDQESQQLEPEEQFKLLIEEMKCRGILTTDIGIEQARRVIRVTAINLHASRTYVPQIYSGNLELFRAKEGVKEAEAGQDEIPRKYTLSRGWDTLTTGEIKIHVVPGNHSTMLDEPQVQTLASLLKDCIDKACGE